MVGNNTSTSGLKDLLFQKSIKVSYDGNEHLIWPNGCFDDLFTRETVSAELWPAGEQNFVEPGEVNAEDRESLVAIILENGKTLFAILLSFLNSGRELRQAINHFIDAGLDDFDLPIYPEDQDTMFKIFHEPGDGSQYREPWSAFGKSSFCDDWQWRFTAPVFHHDQSFLGLHRKTILPFTKVNSRGTDGSGKFGDVREVTVHPAHIGSILPANCSVSIKKLYRPETDDEDKLRELDTAWQKEVHAHQEIIQCEHPNIIKFIAGITKGDDRYLMCEWASGVRGFWNKNKKPDLTRILVEDVIVQIQGITGALRVIHDKGFRHGDLKPENIVRQEIRDPALSKLHVGELKICDMGLTKYHIEATELRNRSTTTKYLTWRYEPPEVYTKHRAWSRRFDIWSIGCLILEFIVWMLEGSEGLEHFSSEIVNDFGQECHYFERERRNGQIVFKTHTAVKEKMKALSSQSVCRAGETALGDLLAIIETRLLVVDLGGANTELPRRAGSADLKEEIDKIVERGNRDPAYWLEGKTREDTPILHPTTAVTRAASERHLGNVKGQLTTESPSLTVPMLTESVRIQMSDVWNFSVDNTFAIKVVRAIEKSEFSPKHTISTNYCAKCQHLKFWAPDFRVEDTWEELENNFRACGFCKMRWEICRHLDRKEFPLVRFQHDQSMLKLNENYPPVLTVRRGPGADNEMVDVSAEKLSHVQIAFPQLPRIASETYYGILRQWLRDCDADHPECSPQQLGYRPNLPTRLIRLRGGGSSAIRVYETRPSDTFKYIALSHPWGKGPHFCTTSANFAAHRKGIDYESLPTTFQHAVDATLSLGLEYLWIDSICIIQGEDGDFDQEAKRMEDVFSSAYCVLATSSARGQNDGFLKPRNHLRQYLTFNHKPGLPTLYISPSMDNFNDDVLKAPLSKRGWVLQERALARRTIYFTERQTYWECGKGVRCETLTKMDNKLVSFLGDANFPSKLSNKSTSRGEKIILYEDLYRSYTRLDLTRISDRPIAIAGLEKRIIRDLKAHGGFGVFDDGRSLLQRSLLWRRGHEVSALVKIFPAPSSISVPSWSWMAYEGGIDYLDLPLGEVDWLPSTEAVQSPWGSKGSSTWHTGDGKESVELKGWARPFAAGLGGQGLATDTENSTIVYDNSDLMEGREPMFVVVGRSKKQSLPKEDVVHYVLVIALCQGSLYVEDGRQRYERVGVGHMKGRFLDLKSRPRAVIIC
ncbi:hypothetical protein G7054_g9799 [Neopestalotiopsis clavispora]|nr:hypothetical protein G7054_g9799 [Neopestalotiopsis clavispora]